MLKSNNRFTALIRGGSFPSAFTFALILIIVVFGLSVSIENISMAQAIDFWGDGFFNLLSFSAQMALVLVCGSALARTHFTNRLLDLLLPQQPTSSYAVLSVTFVSIIGCYFNWGFGLVLSAIVVNKIAKDSPDVNFNLLVSSAYSGFLVWHGGLSGSIPLKLTETGVSLSTTIFSTFNIAILVCVVVTVVVVNFIFSKMKFSPVDISSLESDQRSPDETSPGPLSRVLVTAIGAMALVYAVRFFMDGRTLNLNMMIFIFLILGIVLSGSCDRYEKIFKKSVTSSFGILLQFPFYAGLMSVMDKSGLAIDISQFFISISTIDNFLVNTYLSAGVLNFFVPSGGGQWVIQGPIILSAAKTLGVDQAQAAMAIAWGDAWTNMIQPFWALPILSVVGASLKDIFFHCLILFITVGIVSMGVIFLLS